MKADKSEHNKNKFSLLTSNQVSFWQNDNPYILKGHRQQREDLFFIFSSCLTMHTETLNIWTHLVGSMILIYSWWNFKATHDFTNDAFSSMFINLYFFAGIACLLISTSFHTLLCYSENIKILFNKLDYAGILVSLLSAAFALQHHLFYCQSSIRFAYMCLFTLFSLFFLYKFLSKSFQTELNNCQRISYFILLFLVVTLPTVHFLIVHNQKLQLIDKVDIIQIAAVMGFGALSYGLFFPERICPGSLDFIGNSHQLMHVSVVIGHLLFIEAMSKIVKKVQSLEAVCQIYTENNPYAIIFS
ncbi:MAG: hypothetical protein MHMPM18_000499 [Marteilia pararefringens]